MFLRACFSLSSLQSVGVVPTNLCCLRLHHPDHTGQRNPSMPLFSGSSASHCCARQCCGGRYPLERSGSTTSRALLELTSIHFVAHAVRCAFRFLGSGASAPRRFFEHVSVRKAMVMRKLVRWLLFSGRHFDLRGVSVDHCLSRFRLTLVCGTVVALPDTSTDVQQNLRLGADAHARCTRKNSKLTSGARPVAFASRWICAKCGCQASLFFLASALSGWVLLLMFLC